MGECGLDCGAGRVETVFLNEESLAVIQAVTWDLTSLQPELGVSI